MESRKPETEAQTEHGTFGVDDASLPVLTEDQLREVVGGDGGGPTTRPIPACW